MSPASSAATLRAAEDALSSLLNNWSKSTIDCSVADVSRDLLSSQNKEQLLEKASTFALFDKDSAVMSCKEDNTKVKAFVATLKNLSKEFKSARDIVEASGGDLDAYIENVETFQSSMSSALGFASLMNQDYASINPQKVRAGPVPWLITPQPRPTNSSSLSKMVPGLSEKEQVLTGGNEASEQTKRQLEEALRAIKDVNAMLLTP